MSKRVVLWSLAVVLAVVGLAACHATGPTFTVDTTVDTTDASPGDGVCDDGTGACSLRAAIMEANALPGVDEVQLAPGTTYTLTIAGTGEDAAATGDLDITEGVDLEGDGSTIDAAGLDRVLDVSAPSGLVYVAGVTLTGGSAPDGAAILQRGGATLLTQSTHVTASTATAGAPVSATAGKLTMLVSTISATTGTTAGAVSGTGAAVDLGAATISGTTATAGGTIVNGAGATTKVDESTITANATTTGALDDPGAGMTVLRSIVADQAAGPDCSTGNLPTSGGHNVISDSSCGFAATGDQQGATADLSALLTGLGPVPVHVPGTTSDAVDASTATCRASLDARLLTRPQHGTCDAGAAEVRTLTVTTGGDATDAAPGDGTCDDGTGACPLRAAIDEANATTGHEVIAFDPAVTAVTLSIAGDEEDANATGDLDITDDLTITGTGVTLSGSDLDRVLNQRSGALRLVGLTVTDGASTFDAGDDDTAAWDDYEGFGGGLRALPGLTTRIEDASFVGNEADAFGGGVFSDGDLTILDSVFDSNTSIHDGCCFESYGEGGAVASGWFGGPASYRIERSRFVDNDAGRGGAVSGVADGVITDSTFEGNTAVWLGGAILQDDQDLEITRSTFTGNQAGLTGTVTCTQAWCGGGAIRTQYGSLRVELSTFSGNAAALAGGAISQRAGLNTDLTGTLTIIDTTITANTAPAGAGIASVDPGATGWLGGVSIVGSIVGDNTGSNCLIDATSSLTSSGYNLDADSTCGLTETTDISGSSPLLGPLADNGGHTWTHLPLAGSPVIDAGDPSCSGLDQALRPRPLSTACEIGSVEYGYAVG